MPPFLQMHAIAATRGDGLRPQLRVPLASRHCRSRESFSAGHRTVGVTSVTGFRGGRSARVDDRDHSWRPGRSLPERINVSRNWCDRCGKLHVARLLADHGADLSVPILRQIFAADCPKMIVGKLHDVCSVHFRNWRDNRRA
jgi:hypothetical protein